ncbi:IUNH hydrolase, partial [Polypterus senegalus]
MSKLLLVDVDCGVDDAQALMMALAVPDVKILGITCVHGNTSLDNICKNVLRVLKVCNKLEIPVYRGLARPLLQEPLTPSDFHGKDGLGDASDPDAPGLELLQKEGAVEAMIRIANENEGQVCLVATAPLTNLASAVKRDPSFPKRLKGLYIMGGNMESRGNTTVCGEFNFAADPEAAYIVLNEYLCPTYIATWEFTCYHNLSWEFCSEWMNQDTDKARFMKKIFAHSIKHSEYIESEDEMLAVCGFISCDSYAMAAALDHSFVTQACTCAVSVELSGKLTRGMMVVDNMGMLKKEHKVTIMRKCDLEKFKKLMMAALQ